VESGEGIESFAINYWGFVELNPVESGEGIERNSRPAMA